MTKLFLIRSGSERVSQPNRDTHCDPSTFLSFPSRFVIGRSRGEVMADRRKDELNGYMWHLIHAGPDVAQVSRALLSTGPIFSGLCSSEAVL